MTPETTKTTTDAGHGIRFTTRDARTARRNYTKVLTVWSGRGKKPVYNYLVKEEEITEIVERFVANSKAHEVRKAERKVERAAALAELKKSIKVGTLLHDTSSYNMTFVTFHEVVAVKGANVTTRKIDAEVVTGDGGYTGTKKPLPGQFIGEPAKGKITTRGVNGFQPTTADRAHYFNSLD